MYNILGTRSEGKKEGMEEQRIGLRKEKVDMTELRIEMRKTRHDRGSE